MDYRRTLWTLYAINFLNSVGLWFFLPLLPIFLGRRGSSPALIGVVFAAGLLANALIRYPAGWAADRYGTKVVLIVAMAANALLFLAYLLPLPVVAFVVVRFAQGLASGAYWPAANGLVGEVTTTRERGRAFGHMQATSLAGGIVGPGIGGLLALADFSVIFIGAAAVTAATVIFLAGMRNVQAHETVEVPTHMLEVARKLLPLILLGVGTAYMIGSYDTIWSLYLASRGGSTFAVGVSFAAFALPATFASGLAGTLGERFGARRVVVMSLTATALFAALYPFITSVPWLIAMGVLEGTSSITGVPLLIAEVSHASEPNEQGRTQGVFQTAQTLVQIAGALSGGALFAANHGAAFFAISAVCVLSAGAAFMPLRSRRAVTQPMS